MTPQEIEHLWKVASKNPDHDSNWHDPVVVAFAKSVAALERPWVGLTDDEREKIKAATLDLHGIAKYFATAIEAKLREKNT